MCLDDHLSLSHANQVFYMVRLRFKSFLSTSLVKLHEILACFSVYIADFSCYISLQFIQNVCQWILDSPIEKSHTDSSLEIWFSYQWICLQICIWGTCEPFYLYEDLHHLVESNTMCDPLSLLLAKKKILTFWDNFLQ